MKILKLKERKKIYNFSFFVNIYFYFNICYYVYVHTYALKEVFMICGSNCPNYKRINDKKEEVELNRIDELSRSIKNNSTSGTYDTVEDTEVGQLNENYLVLLGHVQSLQERINNIIIHCIIINSNKRSDIFVYSNSR